MSTIEDMAAPWSDGRPTVYDLVLRALKERESADKPFIFDLPHRTAGRMSWADGALDSLAGWRDRSPNQISARRIAAAINNVIRHPSPATATHLYDLLCDRETISIIDDVLPLLKGEMDKQRVALAELGRRLVHESPEVEPVKVGLALLGIAGTSNDVSTFLLMGLYEELTIYCVVGLKNLLGSDAEFDIWRLAKIVRGWGRVRAVPFLSGTTDPQIKDWMLREGFRNSIMNEYLAYACAVGGDLNAALARDDIDPEFFVASAELLTALIRGGPAKDITDYSFGAQVCIAFLRHAARQPVPHVLIVDAILNIQRLCADERAVELRALPGWDARAFLELRSLSKMALDRSEMRSVVENGLTSDEMFVFNTAADIAPIYGIDPWPLRLARQRSMRHQQWYWLMQVDDRERIAQVLDLAREQLDLELIASGPTKSLGLGVDYADDGALEFILQDLRRFPGMGQDLVLAGLHGRVVRMRNMAIRVLEEWDKSVWPPNTMRELRTAADREPNDQVRQNLQALLQAPSSK